MRLITAILILALVAGAGWLDQTYNDGFLTIGFGKWLMSATNWLAFWN